MTKSIYFKYLSTIQTLHPDSEWLPVLERGYSAANVLYMGKVIVEFGLQPPEPEPIVTDANPVDTAGGADATLKDMYLRLNKLGSQRAKLSNNYHILNTTSERKENNAKIKEIQAVISSLMKEIDYYKATGSLVRSSTNDEFEIPTDKFELQRKILSLRASISRDLKARKNETDPEKLKKINARIESLTKQKTYCEVRIENI